MDRAHDLFFALCDALLADGHGYTEVCKLSCSGAGNQNIMGFDIPMYYLITVGQTKGWGHLLGYADGFLIVESPLFLYDLAQALTVYQFHHYKMDVSFFSHVVNVDYIGMGKACGRLGFLSEVFDEFFVFDELRAQDLDGHISV